MALKDMKLSGKVRTGNGAGVSGATVSLLATAADLDGTAHATTDTTDSDGTWNFTVEGTTYALTNAWDVQIASGDSKRYLPWSDEIALKGVDTSYLKIRGIGANGAAAPLYFIADRGDDNADIWTVQAADGGAFTFESFASGSSVAQLTITPNSTVASSSVVFPGILDVNGSADFDVTDFDVTSSGDIDLVSTNDAAAAIYLRENAGTSGTIKIHADQGTSVTEGAESINILSDAGGVGIRSTANLANAVNLTVDGGTTSSMTLFNDQGTSVTEGSSSIELLSDAGGVELKSTANLAKSIKLIADGGTSETIYIQSDQGTSESSIQLLSDAGGIDIDAATGKDVDIAGGTVNITSSDDAASAIYLRTNAGTSETIKIHADQGTGAGSISAVSDAGGITLDAGLDIVLSADGGNVTMDDGTSTIFDFNVDDTTLTIHDDQDTGDKAVITMAQHGALSIETTDDDAAAANLSFIVDGAVDVDAAGAINLDSGSGIITFEDGGTEVLRLTEGNSGDVTVKLVTNAKDLIFTDNGDATNMKILDAAAGINVPGEVQTTGIGYTDGDNAMTIADGGGVTFPQATTFSSTISTATGSTIGNLTLANGSITDSGGALDFGNETLTTTGMVYGKGGITIGAGGNEFSITESSDDITIKSLISDKDLKISGNDGGSNVDALSFDMSDAGAATFNGKVGVGVSPAALLHVSDNYSGTPADTIDGNVTAMFSDTSNWMHLQLLSSTTTGSTIRFGDVDNTDDGVIAYDQGTDSMLFKTNGDTSAAMTIGSDGTLDLSNNALHNVGDASNQWDSTSLINVSGIYSHGTGNKQVQSRVVNTQNVADTATKIAELTVDNSTGGAMVYVMGAMSGDAGESWLDVVILGSNAHTVLHTFAARGSSSDARTYTHNASGDLFVEMADATTYDITTYMLEFGSPR